MLTKNIAQMRAEIARHIKADAVVQGQYWLIALNETGGRGCFIGCLAHSSNEARLAELYGIPEPVTRICEQIFEAVPEEEAPVFFREIGDAIAVDGKDLSRVVWQFLGETLRRLPEQKPEIQAVIDPVIVGMDLLADGKEWPDAAAYAAARAAAAAYADAHADAHAAARAAEIQAQRENLLRLLSKALVVETE